MTRPRLAASVAALALLGACGGSVAESASPATTTIPTNPVTTTTIVPVRICHDQGRSDLEVHLAPPITDARMNLLLKVITPPTGRGTQEDFLPGFGDLTTDYENGIVWVQYHDEATDSQRASARDTVRRSALVGALLECTDHDPHSGGPLPRPSVDPSTVGSQ